MLCAITTVQPSGGVVSTENEALLRRFFPEFCNDRRDEVADEVIAADYVSIGPQAPRPERALTGVPRLGTKGARSS